MKGETHLVHYIWDTEYLVLSVLYIAGFKGRKMEKFIPDRKNTTIIALGRPTVKTFFPISALRIWFYPIQ